MAQNARVTSVLTVGASIAFAAGIAAWVVGRFVLPEADTSLIWRDAGVLAFGVGAVFCLLANLRYLRRLSINSESMVGDIRQMRSGTTQYEAQLTQINENLLLSDAIKSIAFRDKDRDVLQTAIKTDIRKEMWHSAEMLIEELDKNFACPEEAQRLRQEMEQYRNASIQEKIEGSIKNIESLWMIHSYEEAEKQVEILQKLYSGNELVKSLNGKSEQLKQEHKRLLLDRWDRAIKNNDYEQGVEIIKLLDNYLSASEAAALEESARGVFRAKLHNMGVQFSLNVTNKDWARAMKIGKQIIEEYPNTRMAQEVREKQNILEQRAREHKTHS